MSKIIGLFPGQGSQKVGMGQDLFDSSEIAKKYFNDANEILGFDLAKICFEGPKEKLTSTEIVQPAILTMSTICFEMAKAKKDFQLEIAAGHSLGEYSALVAAGVLSFENALTLVHHRGQYMQSAVAQGEGAMLAVLGKSPEEIEEQLKGINGILEIANINAPGQVVISGQKSSADEFKEKCSGWKLIELEVSAPFHCALMKPAEEKLSVEIDNTEFKDAKFPVCINFNAKPTTKADEFKQGLKDQVCGQVRWVESIENSISEYGIDTSIEFGSGNVLTGLMKRINKDLNKINISNLSTLEKF
ncbi:UNVERIFIED_CONTAM: hypothetical protein GTU68_042609 [Idotea baltica]|nr:hypothetical protein [Idotea baltica]